MSDHRTPAPGWPANWLNGWLAAIGATVLVADTRLSWNDDPVPHALLHHPDGGLDSRIGEALLDMDLHDLPIATEHPQATTRFTRHVTLEAYQDRAQLERERQSGTLAASVSDLRADLDPSKLDHGPFDPSAPRGETLYTRALKCRDGLDEATLTDQVIASREGRAVRVQANGLGFDIRRLSAGVQISGPASKVHVDPIVELLTLAALQLFPTRGDGHTIRQRGWKDRATSRGAFTWPTWPAPLDRWAIDAVLGQPTLAPARYRTVPYLPSNPSDTTRAFAAEPGS